MSLTPNSTFTYNNNTITILQFLDSGGQGSVYKVQVSGKFNGVYALKIYRSLPQNHTTREKNVYVLQRSNIQNFLIPNRHKIDDSRFLWPFEFIEYQGHYGYLMELYTNDFVTIERFVSRPIQGASIGKLGKILAQISLEVSTCFAKLHTQGWCYKDVNSGGIAVNPQTGEVKICDNDNVSAENVENLVYTVKYSAPEIQLRTEHTSRYSDRYSLAILLFELWMKHHPLEGLRSDIFVMNMKTQHKIYGIDPIFVYDPNNNKNRPDHAFQKASAPMWKFLTQELRELFIQTFTEGIREPHRRPNENKWAQAFLNFKDRLVTCPHCHRDTPVCQSNVDAMNNPKCQWVSCRKIFTRPPALKLGESVIYLQKGTLLFAKHFNVVEGNPYHDIYAQVVPVPGRNQLALQNLTPDIWRATTQDNQIKRVNPNQALIIDTYNQIVFSNRFTGRMRT